MFSITLITMGKLKEKFYISAAEEYKKRLGGSFVAVPPYYSEITASVPILARNTLILARKENPTML